MAEKIKFTKNELKKQKDALKRFSRYLPTLELKRKQLQSEITKARTVFERLHQEEQQTLRRILSWADVFGEDIGFEGLLTLDRVERGATSIAGVDIPVFIKAHFTVTPYDLFLLPAWVDRAIEEVQKLHALKKEREIIEEQVTLLQEELRITTQRVNLFEKIKIPQSRDHIRVINIFLGDEQTAGVVRGKISKAKLIKRAEAVPA